MAWQHGGVLGGTKGVDALLHSEGPESDTFFLSFSIYSSIRLSSRAEKLDFLCIIER